MPRRLIVFLIAALAATQGVAQAAPDSPAMVVSPAMGMEAPPLPAGARYATGAYFYGADCGGSSVMTVRAARSTRPGGVILAGKGGQQIAHLLNCDDRRNALASYRDAFQGEVGQAYSWRNPNGGAMGTVTPTGRRQVAGALCTLYRAVQVVESFASTSNGNACREQDGNWYTQ